MKQENNTKSSVIKLLIQSGNTNNYDNDNSYSKSNNNDENNNSGIENDNTNIHIPNDDSNITMRRRKNKSSKDKSTYINNKDKTSNKSNSKNGNNKNNTKNKYNKSSESSRSGLNDTIINTSTYNQKEKVFILDDSMVRNVNGFLMTRNLNHKCLVKVRYFPGAKVRCLHDYVKPTMRDFNPNQIILHVGINDLNSEKTSSQIANAIIDLHNSLKADNNDITISLIAPRGDNLNSKANEVNNWLVTMFSQRYIRLINHSDDIQLERHLNDSKVHLNQYGTIAFAKKITKFLSDLY